jgi:hypothetical protein
VPNAFARNAISFPILMVASQLLVRSGARIVNLLTIAVTLEESMLLGALMGTPFHFQDVHLPVMREQFQVVVSIWPVLLLYCAMIAYSHFIRQYRFTRNQGHHLHLVLIVSMVMVHILVAILSS